MGFAWGWRKTFTTLDCSELISARLSLIQKSLIKLLAIVVVPLAASLGRHSGCSSRGFDPLKLNVVVIPGVNDHQVLDLAALTLTDTARPVY